MPNSAGPLIVRRQPPLKRHPLRVETVALMFLFRPRIEKPCSPEFRASNIRDSSSILRKFLGILGFHHRSNRLPRRMRNFTLRACMSPGPVRRVRTKASHTHASPAHSGLHMCVCTVRVRGRANNERVRACCEKKQKRHYITHVAN